MSWAFERKVFDFTARPGGSGAAARCCRISRSRWCRAAASLAPVTEDLDVRGLSAAGGGDSARSRACRHRHRHQVVRAPDAFGRRAPGQFSAVHAAMGRRHRSRTCCGWCITRGRQPPVGLESGALPQPRRGSADRRCVGGNRRRATAAPHTRRHSGASPRTCRTSALGTSTNVAIFQPDIRGVSLSPIADFTFLRNVYRDAAAPPAR